MLAPGAARLPPSHPAGISDVQISLTSLEEVFLSIARQAELEAAAAEGRGEVEVELDDGTMLPVRSGEARQSALSGE